MLLSWAIICATYLRFCRAAAIQNAMDSVPQEARSPLQPYLAWYGLAMSSLFSFFHSFNHYLTLVIFQGFAVFTRNNRVWSIVSSDWGFEVVPWIMIGGILALFLGCLLHDYLNGRSSKLISLRELDLSTASAPMQTDDELPKNWLEWIVDKI